MATKSKTTIDYEALRAPMEYKFKPQAVKFGKATIVSYIDARDAQDRFDDVCGPENWATDYRVMDGNLYCGIGIQTSPDRWVWKWDCGVESNMEKEKGQASDAFKRAAVQWGVGRFLYRLKVVELKAVDWKGKERPATDDGKILWNNEDITRYIKTHKLKTDNNSKHSGRYGKPDTTTTYNKNPYSQETVDRVGKLEINGKKGKECLKHFLPEFNKESGTDYKSLVDLNDDTKLTKLIEFIEKKQEPQEKAPKEL